MAQITLRLPDDLLADLEREADEHDVSRSEHLRDTLATRHEHAGTQAEYEARIDSLETELERCRNARRQILAQREEHSDLVAAVERERSLQERRAQAGALARLKWWAVGMPDDE